MIERTFDKRMTDGVLVAAREKGPAVVLFDENGTGHARSTRRYHFRIAASREIHIADAGCPQDR